MSEQRDNGLIVDFSGLAPQPVGKTADGKLNVVINPKQESEFKNLSKETRLFRAMNEVRALGAKSLSKKDRAKLNPQIEAIFAKYGLRAADFGI